MSKPWPDEVRQMVDALMHGGACPSVYGCSDGGWRIHTGRAWADYDTHGNACWWFDGSFRNAAFVLAELLQRSDTIAPAQTLSNRILVAVPTARTVTTDDGIEVTVGSKSVRWKRERNGWSLGDDLFTSDDRVVEHAKGMAVDQATTERDTLMNHLRNLGEEPRLAASDGVVIEHRGDYVHSTAKYIAAHASDLEGLARQMHNSLDRERARRMAADAAAAEAQWKLATDLSSRLKAKGVEACTVRNLDTGVVTVSAKDTLGCWHSAELRDGRWHYSGVELMTTAEAYHVLLEAAAPPQPAAPQPSPRAQALLDALRARGYEPTYKRHPGTAHESVLCESEFAVALTGEALWSYLGGQAGTEYVAEQMHQRIARQRERALDTDAALRAAGQRTEAFLDTLNEDPAAAAEAAMKLACTVTADVRSAFSRTFGNEQGERIVALIEAGKYSEATEIIEALTEELEAKQAAAKGPTTMTTKALDQAKVDASEAALRTTAKQLAKAARDPLAGAVARHLAPGDDSMRAKVAAMLETEAGLAMLKAVLSLALGAIPQAGTRGAALAHELRVQAMADGADLALDLVMGPLREVVALYLQDPAGAPAAAPALDAPQHTATEFAATTQREGVR